MSSLEQQTEQKFSLEDVKDDFNLSELQKQLITILFEEGPQDRLSLVEKTGGPMTTVYDSLDRLKYPYNLDKFSKPQTHRGRPFGYFKLCNKD
jgi:hypothetical protein